MSTAFLQVKEITHRYGSRAVLQGISFDVAEGEALGVFGPNGAGKSTTMKIISGLIRPTSGQVLMRGSSVFTQLARWHSLLGVALDDLTLFEYLTVREHMTLSGHLYGMSHSEITSRTEELLEFFTLKDDEKTLAREASHGTRKKLALALSILHAPKILLLDEALNGIDAITARDFRLLLQKMKRKGTTVLLASHMLDSTQPMIDRCIMLNHGEKVFDAPATDCATSGKSLERIYMDVILGAERKEPGLSWV